MDLLRAAYTNDWSAFIKESADLEPLQLSKEEEHVVIARIKKLARDPAMSFSNALELAHRGYEEQEWERQSAIGDLVRPSPSDRAAWEQYEEFIQLAVKLLAKYRGTKGDWRTDKFDTVTTNQRASMGSMAAARVKESYNVEWESLAELNIVCEEYMANDKMFRNNGIVEASTPEAVGDMIASELATSKPDWIVTEGPATDGSFNLFIYDENCDVVDKISIKRTSN